MTDLIELFSGKPKGLRVQPKYIPEVGEVCRVSGPNCDDDKGYTWTEMTVLWIDDTFVLYRKDGCWPVLNKLDHVLFEPMIDATTQYVADSIELFRKEHF